MNEIEYTKGPWCWRNFGGVPHLTSQRGGALIVLQPVRKGMQQASFRVRDKNCIMQDFDPTHPDARLIASAPDLLAALEGLYERYVIAIGEEGPESMAARIAISNAKGEPL